MMFISLALSYVILGWRLNTLVVQFLFSTIYLLLNCQIGRAWGTYYDGDYGKFSRLFSLFTTVMFLFGGTLVSVRNLPWWTPWIVSHNFWATSSAMLDHLQHGEGFGQDPCTSLISCIYSNPNVVAITRGYSPMATTCRSFYVLVGLFLLFFMVEFVITHRTISGFARMRTTPPV